MATAAAIVGALSADGFAAEAKRRNLVWIMTDQQPVSCVGAYGLSPVKTPAIDRLANEGIRLDRFLIAAFPCSPSRASFFTGRYAHNHEVVTNDVPLAADVPVLGDILKKAGYTTGYVGKWHLSGSMYRGIPGRKPFDGRWYYKQVSNKQGFKHEKTEGGTGEDESQHGFDFWVGGWKHYRDYLRQNGFEDQVKKTHVGNHNDLPSGPEGTHIHSKLPPEHHIASFLTQKAMGFLKRQKDPARPFALVLSFYGPHLPVAPPKPWDEMVRPENISLPPNHRDELKDKPIGQRTNRRCYKLPNWTEDQFRDYIRRYYGYCSYIDAQVGRVLTTLDETGRADDTIVLFTSDHGDMVASHGFVFKLGRCGYDELFRVPFLLRCPDVVKTGSRYEALVSSVDVLPTLLELMGIEGPKGMDGRSFLPVLTGANREHRKVVFCNSGGHTLVAVTRRWKYVLNVKPRDMDELYDLQADPGEMKNLAYQKGRGDVVKRMRGRITDWLKETGHPYTKTIVAAMDQEPERRLFDLWPEVTDFRYLRGSECEYRYVWHAVDAPPKDMKYWSFTHFRNKKYAKDGDIVFRDTRWPSPPTTEWQAGERYEMGPVRIKVPPHAGPGKYTVHIGLYNPKTKARPGILARGQGNAVQVGQVTIKKKDGQIRSVEFKPAKKR